MSAAGFTFGALFLGRRTAAVIYYALTPIVILLWPLMRVVRWVRLRRRERRARELGEW